MEFKQIIIVPQYSIVFGVVWRFATICKVGGLNCYIFLLGGRNRNF